MSNPVTSAISSGHGRAVLIAGFVGLVASDIIPTLGDALYFWDQQRLKRLLEEKKITPKQYWLKNAAGYYLYNSAWWALVFGITMASGGDFSHKMKVAVALAGGGAVVGVLWKNIKKDESKT